MPEPITYIKVQTTSYSGATLLSFLLGAHPRISTVGEMNGLREPNLDTYLCSCGKRIVECAFWQSVAALMNDKGFEFDVSDFNTRFVFDDYPFLQTLRQVSTRNERLDSLRDSALLLWPRESRLIQSVLARNVALIESILSLTGNHIFVDTSKDLLRLPTFQRYSSFNIRVIHLVRDVRGFTASMMRHKGKDALPLAVRRWTRFHEKTLRFLARWPDSTQMLVRYEDLCRSPDEMLRKMYNFCGTESQVEIGNYQEVVQHIIGNSMRLANARDITLDEKWKRELTREQQQFIEQRAGSLNRRLGYVAQEVLH